MCCPGGCCKNENLRGWHQVLRWLMFISNFLIFCGGAFLLSYSIYLIDSKWTLFSSDDNIIPVIMFLSFAFILLVTTIGSLAACHLSRILLITYICITIFCLILEVTLVSLIATSNFNKNTFLKRRWKDLSNSDKEWLEDEFNCCGFNSNIDADRYCGPEDATTNEPEPYCEKKLRNYASDVERVILILGIVTLVFQLFGTVVSIILIKAIKASGRRVRDDSYIEYSYFDEL